MNLKCMVVGIIIFAFALIALAGCPSAQESASKRWAEKVKIPKEDWGKFNQITENQRQEIIKYRNEFGAYPIDLNELKNAGYTIYKPYENYKWSYKLDPDGANFEISQEPDYLGS